MAGIIEACSEEVEEDSILNEFKLLPHLLKNKLLGIWEESNDPFSNYFHMVDSYTDIQLLDCHMKKKKNLGLLFLLNLVNILYIMVPHSSITHWFKYSQEDNFVCTQLSCTSSISVEKTSIFFLVNIVAESLLFCFTIFFCLIKNHLIFHSLTDLKQILVVIMLQYFITLSTIVIPNYFLFQFVINMTLGFILFLKEEMNVWDSKKTIVAINIIICNSIVIPGGLDIQNLFFVILLAFLLILLHLLQEQVLQFKLSEKLVAKLNQLRKNLEIKDVYHASMIHELRNPLNAILGAIGLLKYSNSLSNEDVETLNIASVSGEILITLINNALDGAKIEANKLELDPHVSNLVDILTKSVSLYTWKAKEKNINIGLKIGKYFPDTVVIDDARLTQILVNLIGNALKFTPDQGKVKVRARFISIEQDQKELGSFSQLKKKDLVSDFLEDNENEFEYEEKKLENKQIKNIDEELKENDYLNDISMDQPMIPLTKSEHQNDLEESKQSNIKRSLGLDLDLPILNKKDSMGSLTQAGSVEDRGLGHRDTFLEREMIFKNSFNFNQPNSTKQGFSNDFQEQIRQQTELKISLHGLESNMPTFQNIQDASLISQTHKNNLQGVIQSPIKKRIIVERHDSSSYSEHIFRISSLHMECQEINKFGSRTNTSGQYQNILSHRKSQKNKSKFCKSNQEKDKQDQEEEYEEQDEQDDDSSDKDYDSEEENEILTSNVEENISIHPMKGTIIIEVIDTGIGISPDGIKRLFQPFSQADKSIQSKYGGTGLGLWISNKLVSLMKGQIRVKSEINRGTAFIIEIPVNAEFKDKKQNKASQDLSPLSQQLTKQLEILANQQSQILIQDNNPKLNLQRKLSLKQQIMNCNINVLLFENDEMSNLFVRYFKRHNIKYQIATSFKNFLKAFQTKQFRAGFFSIDVNVKIEDLERFHDIAQKLKKDNFNNFKLYCLYSKEIEKRKKRVLNQLSVSLLKKPIQIDNLSKIMRDIKNMDLEMQLRALNKHQRSYSRANSPKKNKSANNVSFRDGFSGSVQQKTKEQIQPVILISNSQDQQQEPEEEKTIQMFYRKNSDSSGTPESVKMERERAKGKSFFQNQFSFSGDTFQKMSKQRKLPQDSGYDSDKKGDVSKLFKDSSPMTRTQIVSPLMTSPYNRSTVGYDEEEEKKTNNTQQTPCFNYSLVHSSRNNSNSINENSEFSPQIALISKVSAPIGAVAAVEIQSPSQFELKMNEVFILIVDDDKMNSMILTKMLEKDANVIKHRIKIIVAENGQQALQTFEQYQYQGIENGNRIKLILMDGEMPIMNGYDASKRIRDCEIGNLNKDKVMIVGLSGNSGEFHIRRCKLAGMNDSLTKPIVFDQLVALVSKALIPFFKQGLSMTNKY